MGPRNNFLPILASTSRTQFCLLSLPGCPSVIFLDEPTSGLDSRGALVVMRAMKRIADSGRTVCSTVHQPSGVSKKLVTFVIASPSPPDLI